MLVSKVNGEFLLYKELAYFLLQTILLSIYITTFY